MYQLKNVSVNQRMSEETTCFVADLYRNGVKLISVSNRGYGGSHNYDEYVKGSLAEADVYAKSLPNAIYCGRILSSDLDSLVDTLLNEYLLEKDAKKYLKKFCFKDEGNLYTLKADPNCPKSEAWLKAKYPNAVIMRDVQTVVAHLRAGQS